MALSIREGKHSPLAARLTRWEAFRYAWMVIRYACRYRWVSLNLIRDDVETVTKLGKGDELEYILLMTIRTAHANQPGGVLGQAGGGGTGWSGSECSTPGAGGLYGGGAGTNGNEGFGGGGAPSRDSYSTKISFSISSCPGSGGGGAR